MLKALVVTKDSGAPYFTMTEGGYRMPKKKKKPIDEELVKIDSHLFKIDSILEEEDMDDDFELFTAIEEEI